MPRRLLCALHRPSRLLRSFSLSLRLSNGVSSPSTAVLSRINTVEDLFENSHLEQAAYKCDSLYKRENESLLQDLLQLGDSGVFASLLKSYKKHILVRTMVHNDAIRLLLKPENDVAPLQYAINGMLAAGVVSKAVWSHLGIEPSEKDQLADFFLVQQAVAGDPMLATASAIRLKAGGITVDEKILIPIIRALLVDTGINHNYHAYTLLRLTDEFLLENLPQDLLLDILAYMLHDQTPFFANIWFKRVQNRVFDDQTRLLHISAQLLEANSTFGIEYLAIHVWEISCGREKRFPDQHPRTVSIFLQLLMDSESPQGSQYVESIMKELPEDVILHPDLIEFSLRYYGLTNKARFEALVKQLVPPLLRLALSALFQGFLNQSNQFAADKVLQLIFLTKSGTNARDFDAIVKRLLDQNNLDECLSMLGRTDLEVSKRGQVSIMKHILQLGHQKKYPQLTKDIARNFRRLQPNDDALDFLTMVFFRHFSGKVSNRACRQLYTRLAQNASQGGVVFDLEKYGIPQGFFRLLRLDVSNKMAVLKVIGKQAICEKDIHVLKWVVTVMKTIGVSQHEALHELERIDGGIKEILRSLGDGKCI